MPPAVHSERPVRRGHRRRGGLRLAGIAALAGSVITASALLVPGSTSAAQRAAAGDRERTTGAVAPAQDERHTVRLATGERVELVDGGNVGIVPKDGRDTGRYAFTSADGTLSIRPVSRREPVAATEIPSAAKRALSPMAYAASATYPVKFTITNADVTTKSISLWNRAGWISMPVDGDHFGPDATAQLPPGNYFAVALHSDWGKPSYLLARTFTVTDSGTTVRFDESLARETAVRPDNAAVAREASAVWISVPGGDLAGFAGSGRGKVYTTPFSVSGVSLRVHDVLTRRGSSASAPGPYRYDLVHSFENTVPPSPIAAVRTADLAKASVPIRSQGVAARAVLNSAPALGDSSGVYIGGLVRTGATTTEYVTPGVRYSRMIGYGGHRLTLPGRTLAAGTTTVDPVVGAAPFGPRDESANASSRLGTTIRLYEPSATDDAAGNEGIDDRARVSFRLTSGGRTLASADGLSPYKVLSASVPDGTGDYELEHTVARTSGHSRLSPLVRSEWAFTSRDTSARNLPLIDVGLDVSGLDPRNAAGTAPVTVGVTTGTRDSEADETVTALEYSADDGATWTDLPFTAAGPEASAKLAVPATAPFVSLRVTAVNDEGGSVRRTVIRAFGGPAAQGDEQAGGMRISDVVVNGGKPVVLTAEALQEFTARFTVTAPSGVAGGDLYLYSGSHDAPRAVLFSSWPAVCAARSATTSVCEAQFAYIEPRSGIGLNTLAGTWRAAALARSEDGTGHALVRAARNVPVQHDTRLTFDASPEPVSKGGLLTLTGKLTRADWQSETHAYRGYGGQSVKVQYCPQSCTAYSTVKTVTLSPTGTLRTTVTASADGYWRLLYPGTAGDEAVKSAADHVDVR
jgi:hypothetical protein